MWSVRRRRLSSLVGIIFFQGKLLQEDGTSFFLLEDGTSFLLGEG